MTLSSPCPRCGAPSRKLWPPTARAPRLEIVARGEWTVLGSCPDCARLWMSEAYEPYASFVYLVLWPHTAADWRQLYDLDQGLTLHHWHLARTRACSSTLDGADREAIDRHEQRSYGRTPFNTSQFPPVREPDLEGLLAARR